MKKLAVVGIMVILALFILISCEEGLFVSKAGPADAEEALRLIPKDVTAVFFIDIQRVMTVEFINNQIKEKKENATSGELTGYEEFKAKTGIDPEKDIHFVVGALTGETEKGRNEGVGIVNLTYDKDLLLSTIREKIEEEEEKEEEEEQGEEKEEQGLIEEEYNGFTIYTVREGCEEEKEEEKEEPGEQHVEGGSFTFLDKSNMAVGDKNSIKSVIDVLQKKKENLFKNEGLSALLAKINKETMFWGTALVPKEALEEAISEKPGLAILEGVKAASFSLDYKNKNIMAEIKIMSSDPTKNQELADNLKGYKDIAALIQIQDLNMADILDRIEITSFPDHVNISAAFPEDLPQTVIDKLKMSKTPEEKKEF
jgi:hypothetical protein